MNTQNTQDQFLALRLHGMARRYETICQMAIHQQPEAHALAAMLTEAEADYRLYQRTQLYLRMAKLRYSAHPEQVHCGPDRGLSKEQLLLLADGSFIAKGEHVLISGATGCGKSYLACALGRMACNLGQRTLYYSMNRFIEQIAAARLEGSYIKWLNQIAKTALLILDDFGLQPISHDVRITLLQILEDRYGSGAVIITSQLPVNKWYEYLGEPTSADAICDRLTAMAHRIELKGTSRRKQ